MNQHPHSWIYIRKKTYEQIKETGLEHLWAQDSMDDLPSTLSYEEKTLLYWKDDPIGDQVLQPISNIIQMRLKSKNVKN